MFDTVKMLVDRCIQGDEKAWKEFIERFSGILEYSARARLARSGIAFGQQDIEDIVQVVFAEILEKGLLREVRDRNKIEAWLSIVAQTRALNHARQRKERLLRQDELYKIDGIEAGGHSVIDEGLMGELEKAMEGLAARDKIILKLNIIHDKTHREISGFMKIPINTVSTIIARNKAVLKEKIGGSYGMFE